VVFFSRKTGQFTYFSQQVGENDWRGKSVLDFGGNIGNILRDPASTIDEDRYWCLDVVEESIDRGKVAYPKANWLFYDRYCFFFNPYGDAELPVPELGRPFDFIVAYSVFTNTSHTDMIQLVGQLESMLTPHGVLAFTFIDPHHRSWPAYGGNNYQWRLEQERGDVSTAETQELIKRVKGASWFMLVNGEDLYVEREDVRPYPPSEQKTCHVFHTVGYMRSLFPHATILPPANNEMQHCCVIRRS
jgi:hypothetical protein